MDGGGSRVASGAKNWGYFPLDSIIKANGWTFLCVTKTRCIAAFQCLHGREERSHLHERRPPSRADGDRETDRRSPVLVWLPPLEFYWLQHISSGIIPDLTVIGWAVFQAVNHDSRPGEDCRFGRRTWWFTTGPSMISASSGSDGTPIYAAPDATDLRPRVKRRVDRQSGFNRWMRQGRGFSLNVVSAWKLRLTNYVWQQWRWTSADLTKHMIRDENGWWSGCKSAAASRVFLLSVDVDRSKQLPFWRRMKRTMADGSVGHSRRKWKGDGPSIGRRPAATRAWA